MQKWPLLAWSRYIYCAAVFVALIGIIPAVWFPLQIGKVAAFAVLVFVASVCFFVGGGTGGVFGRSSNKSAFLVALLPLAYLLSYAFSIDRSVGLLGYAVEGDTVLFALLAFLSFIFAFFLFRRFRSVRLLLGAVFLATAVAIVFQFISILLGTHVLSALFSDPSVNLVGKWNDLGLLSGLMLVLLLAGLERGSLSLLQRIVAWCSTAVLVLFLALVQFPLVWGLVLGASIALGLWSFVSSQRTHEHSKVVTTRIRTLPWLPIAAAVISILFLLWGAAVQGGLVKVFPVSSLEVRPALSTTLDIVRMSHGSSFKRFLVGTGPETFGDDWFLYKPAEINQSQYWNLNFNAGYSTFSTALGSVGIVGILIWLLPLLLVLLGLVRVMRSNAVFAPHEKLLAFATALGSAYLWCSAFFYAPSENIILLAFVLSGASFAFSMKSDASASSETSPSRVSIWLFRGAILICVILAGVATFFIVRRYIAEMYTNEGLYALQQNNISGGLTSADQALSVERTGDTLGLAVLAGTSELQQIVSATSTPSSAVQQQFASIAQVTLTDGQQSILKNPDDYRTYLGVGKLYDLLASVGVQGAYDSAKRMYASAAMYNPTDPEIPLDLAHLESVHGDTSATTAALQQSLQLKFDYTDAILFVVQLDVANKDINSAIVAAKAAVNSAPGVSSIWFELGLLYYSNNDTKDAIQPLEQAVHLESDYANAKYFLGLSYAAQNRTADAIMQFEDLAVTNANNTEVQLILSNLKAGKAPFDGATPPVTPTPQDRATAPISQ